MVSLLEDVFAVFSYLDGFVLVIRVQERKVASGLIRGSVLSSLWVVWG